MDVEKTKDILKGHLARVRNEHGAAATERFSGLRDVDHVVREVKIIIRDVEGVPPALLAEMDNDADFSANSRRVRLEAIGNYVNTVLKFLETKVYRNNERIIFPCPDVSKLTSTVNGLSMELKQTIERRWLEAQRCMYADCHLSAIILMGSVLEALLLARALIDGNAASASSKAPRDRNTNNVLQIPQWKLSALIDVAADLKWIKADRAKFSHALRESRNMVHPYEEARNNHAFDAGSSKTCWQVVNAAVDDILN